MGVAVTNLDAPVGDKIMRKKILVASKDYKAGETIYKVMLLHCFHLSLLNTRIPGTSDSSHARL